MRTRYSALPQILPERPDPFEVAFGKRGILVYVGIILFPVVTIFTLVILLATMKVPIVRHPFIRYGVMLCVPWYGYWAATSKMLERNNYFEGLESVEDMSERLGTSEAELEQRLRGIDIQPRYVVNGRKLYDRKDLGDAATLLRSSAAPAEKILLKPMATTEKEAQNLVRPV